MGKAELDRLAGEQPDASIQDSPAEEKADHMCSKYYDEKGEHTATWDYINTMINDPSESITHVQKDNNDPVSVTDKKIEEYHFTPRVQHRNPLINKLDRSIRESRSIRGDLR